MRIWWWIGFAGGVLVLASDVLYLAIIRAQQHQGEPLPARVPFVGTYILALGACCFAGLLGARAGFPHTQRAFLLYTAGFGCVAIGIPAILRIGILWIVSGVACLLCAASVSKDFGTIAVAFVGAVGVLMLGLLFTS